MSTVYPLKCQPVLKERVWGGRGLAELYGKRLPPDKPIGESWEVADLPEGTSTVANGPLAGHTLREVNQLWGVELAGRAWPPGRFPLLVKLLDAQDDLSIQVHPSEADCQRWFPRHRSKDESWVVLRAQPGGRVIYGVRPGTRRAEFERRIEDGTILECLNQVEVRPDQVLRIAPGTVHALGRGVMVLEIQQPSDSTFRIFDYGRGRAVHVADALKVVDLTIGGQPFLAPLPTSTRWGSHELLVDVRAYRIERLQIERSLEWTVLPRTAQTLTVLHGRGTLEAAGEAFELVPGESAIVPAKTGRVRFAPLEPTTMVIAGAAGHPLCDAPH